MNCYFSFVSDVVTFKGLHCVRLVNTHSVGGVFKIIVPPLETLIKCCGET